MADRKRSGKVANIASLLWEDQWPLHEALDALRRYVVIEALHATASKAEAAERLGVHPNTVTRTCREFGFTPALIEELRHID